MKHSTAQKIAKFFSSKAKFAAMEKESREWKFTCSSCGNESDVWTMGGIRYKAKGNPSINTKCPNCGHVGVEKLSKVE